MQVLIHGPANSIIQGIYAKEFGVSLHAIALILLIAGLLDVVTNPLIGYGSDRYRISRGSRKPWLLVGAALAVVACWFLIAAHATIDLARDLSPPLARHRVSRRQRLE